MKKQKTMSVAFMFLGVLIVMPFVANLGNPNANQAIVVLYLIPGLALIGFGVKRLLEERREKKEKTGPTTTL